MIMGTDGLLLAPSTQMRALSGPKQTSIGSENSVANDPMPKSSLFAYIKGFLGCVRRG